MRKQFFFLVLFILSLSPFCSAQWVPLENTSLPGSRAEVSLISDSPSETILKINLPGFYIKNFTADGKEYQRISIGDEAISSETGCPDLPYIAKVLAIPDNGTVQVEVLETGPVQKFEGISIPPVRESWIEGKPETKYLEDARYYSSGKTYPASIASAGDPAVFRDFRIARVSVFPIRYSPAKHELEVVSSVTVRVKYMPGLGINPKTTPHRPIVPSFGKLYRSFIFNYENVLQRDYNGCEVGQELMLCIMPDEFVNTFLTYAEWKEKTGTRIHITKFSDIGANSTDYTIIKNHILFAYENWNIPPSHVLIIGDKGIAPYKTVTLQGWNFVNEDYFVELDGSDYFPEMYIGRFTNQTDYRLQVMVNKFMNYEKYPYIENVSWYKKATVCSNNAYISQVETKRFAANEMTEYGYFTVDTLMSDGYGSGCSMNLSDVIATINEGRSFLNYRGEGWTDGWHANCYQFLVGSVSSLNNGHMLPFVTSIGCGVAQFIDGQCFGEEWIELGTPTEPRGACAFLGPTSNTHTAYNNEIDKGIYIGMFQEGINSPGEALVRGKLNMYQVFGGTDPFVEYHYKIYCALGDPSLHVWKNVPRTVNVTYPSQIPTGYSQVQVKVTDIPGIPIFGARVCISGSNFYALAYTDLTGTALLDVNVSSESELALTVTGDIVYPFEGVIHTVQAVENIAPLPNPLVTDVDGNNDGLINPNENCSITFTLKNWGNTTSYGVTATLLVPDTIDYVDVTTTDPIDFGDISVGDSVLGDPFGFYIHPDCPVGFIIPFKLQVQSQGSNWEYYSLQLVHGCKLKYLEYQVDDAGNILFNHRMDPGETVKVNIKVLNNGDDIAPDVKGILSCSDQYITVIDSTASFGTFLPDSSGFNLSDNFVVKVSDDCPLQYDVNYQIRLFTENGLYPYSISSTFTIPVAQPSQYDPTGPDAYGYYAYSSDDTLWRQAPEFNWVDITTVGTQIPRPAPPYSSDFSKVMQLPFTFKYYGNNCDSIQINSDGWIALNRGTLNNHENQALPNPDEIHNMVAAFWDDLFSTASGEDGKIYYYYDSANHRFIISWEDVGHVSDVTDKETFQIILLDPQYYPTSTGDGEIIIQYKVVEEPGSCTVGIENYAEDIGLDYLFNDVYDVTASMLQSDFAIKFTTDSAVVAAVEGGEANRKLIPTAYALEQNYPNPFNPETHIRYSLPEPGYISLKIYRMDGQLIKVLYDNFQPAGSYEKVWDGTNDHGTKVSSGVYFYRLSTEKFTRTKKMIFLK